MVTELNEGDRTRNIVSTDDTEHEIIVWWGTAPGNVSWCWTISVTCELYLGGVKV